MPTAKKHAVETVRQIKSSTCRKVLSGNTAYPHQIVIDLGKEYNVTGFRMLPRAEAGAPGLIKDYKVYVKKSDFTY